MSDPIAFEGLQIRLGEAVLTLLPTADGRALQVCPVTEHIISLEVTHGGEMGLFLLPVALTDGLG